MKNTKTNTENIQEEFLRICPDAIDMIEQMITDPDTPVTARVQLIGMVLDRALGRPETSLKVTTEDMNFEIAEAQLMEMVTQIQLEEGMIPGLTEGEGGEDES